MPEKRLRRWILFLAAVVLLNCFAAPALAAEEQPHRVLTVAFPDSPGISEVYEDGTYGGSVYDWLHEIAKYTGWEYEFVTGGAVELLNGMRDGKYDLMGGMYYLDGFEEIYNYPKYVMGSNYSLLMYHRDDDTIKSFDYTTLNGKTIGVFKNAVSKIDRLNKFLSFNHIQCPLVYYETTEEYAVCLDNGEVDLLYGSDVYMDESYNVAAKIEADPYYIVTNHEEPELCEQLSEAMAAIYSANPNFAMQLYEKYFPAEYINTIDFTSEEQEFIRQSEPVRVAVVRQMYPLYDENSGVAKGIVPDSLALVTDRTGLKFEYVFADSYGDLTGLLERGEADMIGCYLESERSADEDGVACTAPLVSLDLTLVRNKYSDLSQAGLIMAVPAGKRLTSAGQNSTQQEYRNYEDCLRAVNRGDADYTYIPSGSLEWLYAQDYYANVTISVDTVQRAPVTFAVSRPVNVLLYSVLSKAIGNFTEAEINSILSQNLLPTPAAPASLKSLFYSNPIMVISVSVGFVVLAAAVLLLIGSNKMKTRIMRVKLEKAEEASREKSEFLSRMSHEIRTPMNAIIGLTNLAMMTEEASPALREDLEKIDTSAKFLLSLLNDVLDMSKIESRKMKLSPAPFHMDDVVGQLRDIFALQAEQKKLSLTFDCRLEDRLYVGDSMRLSQILTNLLSNAYKFTDPGGRIALTVQERECSDGEAALYFSVQDSGVGICPEDQERIFLSFEQAADKKPNTQGTGLGLAISRSLVELMGGELKLNSIPGEGSEFYFTIRLPVFRGTLEREEPLPDRGPAVLAGLRVLLAEDNDINAEIAEELLGIQQVKTERAENGRQAVDMYLSHPEDYYDAIFMDVNMPVMDGLQAAGEIRAADRPGAAVIPILAMTANTFQEDREKAEEAGMTGFLSKPFDAKQLYEALAQAAGRSKPAE